MLDNQKLQNLLWLVWKDSYLEYTQFSKGKEQQEELWRKQGEAIQTELREKVRASVPYIKGGEWMMSDSSIQEMTISPEGREINLLIEGVTDYDIEPYKDLDIEPKPITIIDVHMRLKGVQDYRILWIEDGKIVEEDNQTRHLRERMREGEEFIQWTIVNDYYEMYEEGGFHLLILVPREDGVCIEVVCQDMELTSQVDKRQNDYLKNFLEWNKR